MISKIKDEYLEGLKQILKLPDGKEKQESFIALYTRYAKFCYEKNLSTYDRELFMQSDTLFIIESTPFDYEINEEKKNGALAHLEATLERNEVELVEGLSKEEAEILLQCVVQNTRLALAKQEGNVENFMKASLDGACGYAQGLTALSLEELHVPITINNTRFFPDCQIRHAFITCTFPIQEASKTTLKHFLIDTTYRQFFRTIYCNEGRLYNGDSSVKNKTGIDPGYYLMQSQEGQDFSKELLTKGYIELTDENMRLYGFGFSCTSLSLTRTLEEEKRIQSHTAREYQEVIFTRQEALDYEKDDFILEQTNIDLKNPIPSLSQVEFDSKNKQNETHLKEK